MALFGKKSNPTQTQGIPVDKVIQMRQQSISNDQIIQSLQQEGYNSSQIFDAMSQADIKGTVSGDNAQQGEPIPPEQMIPEVAPIDNPLSPQEQAPMPPPLEPSVEGMPPPMRMPMDNSEDRAVIEEIAESIIDEKWEQLIKNVDKIVEWKESTESKLVKMDQQIKDIKERFEVLHKGILTKVSEYDKGMKTVGTDVKAMEQVFKKILPTFTENVNDLSRITKNLKKTKKK